MVGADAMQRFNKQAISQTPILRRQEIKDDIYMFCIGEILIKCEVILDFFKVVRCSCNILLIYNIHLTDTIFHNFFS